MSAITAAMANVKKKNLLATQNYDNDAAMVDSDFDSETSSVGDESEIRLRARDSVQEGDREILKEADEQERLLVKPARFDAVMDAFGKSHRREMRRLKRADRRPDIRRRTLIYEMEDGFKNNSSQSSFEIDEAEVVWQEKSSRGYKNYIKLSIVHIGAILLFMGLALGALRASKHKRQRLAETTFWNGTHSFKPTTILISLDGFRADFLNRGLTPAMNAFVASGVSPRYMLPSFPSVTFPNHFTLVTGLYPESHGIVGNQFWDPSLKEMFYYTQVDISMQPKWWNAEPIWVTAENQGVRTAVHMWPGSEAHIPDIEPTYIDKYNESELLTRKVDRLLHWLDLPGDDDDRGGDKRPQLLLAYVPNVDADGHKYGPNSTQIRGTIADVDSMLTILVEGLLQRNLTEIVNLVVVSDHGMATTSNDRLIQLDDLIDMSLVDHIDGWPLRGLRLKNPNRDVPVLYKQLLKEAEKTNTFEVYTLETMPERYHFSNNDRIAPLWVVPKAGWAVVEKDDFDVEEAKLSGKIYEPLGLHGYDHEHPLMRAIFIARGPAFPHSPNSRVSEFQNIEVYNIVCDSVGIKAHPNNGTLRLPLQTNGLHSDADAPQPETPLDSPDHETMEGIDLSTSEPPQYSTTAEAGPTRTSEPEASETVPNPDAANDGSRPKAKTNWWDFLHKELEKAKELAEEIIEALKNNKSGSDTKPPT